MMLADVHVWLDMLWIQYNAALKSSPLITKMLTAAVMTTISDTVAQAFTALMDGVAFSFDPVKTMRLVMFGAFYMGPAVHYWNRLMELLFSGWNPAAAVAIKVALDQTAFTLLCSVLTIAALTWAERRPMAQVPGRVRSSLWVLLKANWKVWGPTMVVVYAMVEEDLRPLVLNIVSIGWQVFYLMLLRPEAKEKDIEQGEQAVLLKEVQVHAGERQLSGKQAAEFVDRGDKLAMTADGERRISLDS